MYQDAMQSIRDNLIQKGPNRGLTHTVELIPSRQLDGQVYAIFFLSFFSFFATAHRQSTDHGNYHLNKII